MDNQGTWLGSKKPLSERTRVELQKLALGMRTLGAEDGVVDGLLHECARLFERIAGEDRVDLDDEARSRLAACVAQVARER